MLHAFSVYASSEVIDIVLQLAVDPVIQVVSLSDCPVSIILMSL
jgi:hypothetical protein